MRGRKPIPDNIKRLKGTLEKSRVNEEQPEFNRVSHIEPPEGLGDIATQEWLRVVPLLDAAGVLTEADVSALRAYCLAYQTFEIAAKAVEVEGITAVGHNGGVSTNPSFRVMKEAGLLMHRYLTEFGLTPSSRSRVKANPPRKDSEWDGFNKKQSM
jgi:P27 family predicted phage terminase small subunit